MHAPRCTDTDYIDFLVATPRAVSCVEAARVQPRRAAAPAHDAFTRLLHRLEPDPAALWEEVEPLVDWTKGILVGEIRGADRLYDLGHFLLHDGERITQQLFPHLLAGYQELIPLLPDHKKRIRRIAIMIGVSGLGRLMQRRPEDYRSAPLYQWLVRKLPVLLEGELIGT